MQEQWGKNDGVKVPHVFCAPRGGRGGSWVAVSSLPALESYYSRWIRHCENRLEYERAMLAEEGGTVADKTGPEKGGACKCWAGPRGGYAYIQKVNKVSVTILDNWGNGGQNFSWTIPFDKLTDVMTAAQVQAKREAGLHLQMQKELVQLQQMYALYQQQYNLLILHHGQIEFSEIGSSQAGFRFMIAIRRPSSQASSGPSPKTIAKPCNASITRPTRPAF